jgi:hypothetical protein
MAHVRTFRIHPINGLPDRDVTEFLTECEKEGIIKVETVLLPAIPEKNIDNRLTVIATKLDDHPVVIRNEISDLTSEKINE